MSECPRQKDHERMKRRRAEAELIGVHDDGVERYELVNCPACRSTLARPCVDARHVDSEGRPLCGSPAEGSFLVDKVEDSSCPLCVDVIERLLRAAG